MVKRPPWSGSAELSHSSSHLGDAPYPAVVDSWLNRQRGWRRAVLMWAQMWPASAILWCGSWELFRPGARVPGAAFPAIVVYSLAGAVPLVALVGLARRVLARPGRHVPPALSWRLAAGAALLAAGMVIDAEQSPGHQWPGVSEVLLGAGIVLILVGLYFRPRRAEQVPDQVTSRSAS